MRKQKKSRRSGYGGMGAVHEPSRPKRSSGGRLKYVILGMVVVILLVVCGFQYKELRTQDRYRASGVKAYEAGDYEKAQAELEQSIEHKNLFGSKLTTDVNYYLAESLFQQKEYKEAMAIYDDMIRKDKNNGILYCFKGACYAKMEDEASAISNFNKAKKLGEEQSLHYLSRMYYDKGDYAKAVTYEEQYVKKHKNDGISYIILAKGYTMKKEYKKALSAIDTGLALKDSNQQELAFQKVVIYEKMLDFDKAYEACKAYMKQYPDDKYAKLELEFLESR